MSSHSIAAARRAPSSPSGAPVGERGLLGRLALTNIANCDVFTGQGIPTLWGRLYGGQAVTQSLMAAQSTVDDPALHVHSLHGYFILAGNPAIPILFEVERVRDGKSFATRSVKAVQENRCIFTTIVSFHRDEPGPSYQIPVGEIRALLPGKREKWVTGTDTPSPEALMQDGVRPDTHNGMSWMSILPVAEGDRCIASHGSYRLAARHVARASMRRRAMRRPPSRAHLSLL